MNIYSNLQLLLAVVAIGGTVYFLAKQYETRMVLIGAGLFMCLVSLLPLNALNAFVASMTTPGLITNICSAMGFAYVMKLTKCDSHLVRLLLKPMRNLGFFMIPSAVLLTLLINIAIPSAAGCAAAVGATLIPLMIASGVHPAMAASTVFVGTFGSIVSPGLAHTAIVAQMTGKSIMETVTVVLPYGVGAGIITIVGLALMALLKHDYQKPALAAAGGAATGPGAAPAPSKNGEDEPVNLLYAFAPLLPLVILIGAHLLRTETSMLETYKDSPAILDLLKIGVAQAMIIGTIYGLVVTMSSPSTVTKQFFSGMGIAYADVMGIIIAASVFAAGLEASGAIKWFIGALTESPQYARWGSTLGPFFMGLISGSGDAATIAFNKSVTPHAATFGFDQAKLGMAAALAGALGRSASPIAGAAIVCAGLAGNINPVEIAKRTAPVMGVAVIVIALWML